MAEKDLLNYHESFEYEFEEPVEEEEVPEEKMPEYDFSFLKGDHDVDSISVEKKTDSINIFDIFDITVKPSKLEDSMIKMFNRHINAFPNYRGLSTAPQKHSNKLVGFTE